MPRVKKDNAASAAQNRQVKKADQAEPGTPAPRKASETSTAAPQTGARQKAAAPRRTPLPEDTVDNTKPAAKRGQKKDRQPDPITQPEVAVTDTAPQAAATKPKRAPRKLAEDTAAAVPPARTTRVKKTAVAPTLEAPQDLPEPTLSTLEQTPVESPAPRRGRQPKAKTAAQSTPAVLTAAMDTASDVPSLAESQPELPEPARMTRGRGKAVPEVEATLTAEAELVEPPAAEPAPTRRRGRTAKSVDIVAEPVSPAADLVPPTPVKRGRRKKADVDAEAALPALTDEVVIEPEAAVVAEPVILDPPKRRGRKPKAAPATTEELPPLAGVEEVHATGDAPLAVPTTTGATTGPLVDSPVAVLDPEELPAEHTPPVREGRKGRRGAAVSAPAAEDKAEESTGQGNPAQELVIAQLRKLGRPLHVRDLEKTFTRQALDKVGGWRELGDLLEELVEAGTVIRTRKKTYGLPEAMSLVRGRFQASAAGFGFVVPDSGGDDFYIPAEQTMEAWNGDIVLVRMEGRGDRGDDRGSRGSRRGQKGDGNPRASVIRIVQRAYSQLVGTLEFHHGHPILKPDDHRARHRILLLPEGLEGLQAGARVVTELFWPEHTGEDEVFGQIKRVLGAEDDPETETEAVIVKFGLRGEFPAEVEAQAAAIPTQIPAEALGGRLDLREFNIFTVDGRDAKDFDDAIHIQPTPEGNFVVGVHIADVSHYVQEGAPLDEEAYARATSVYLPGRVLPMLPEHLSNGVCSLVPYEDRLTLTALVELSPEGEILHVQLAPSVINSKARLTYDEVQAYSEATATLPDHARHLEGDLHLLLKITSKLRQKRLREGSLDFKMREVKVDVGPDGKMELIPIREETARGMIEDLMLLANKVVAHELLQREIPALFRIHEEPTLQRFQEVTQAIGRLGFAFPGGEPTPQAYQAVLKQVRGTPRESVVNTLLLRSMQQAKYAGENLGHFGLAFGEYLHFTSPIRRYPDLLVHRVLKGMLAGDLKAGSREVAQLQSRLPEMGNHTSDRERAAAEAERDLTKYYQAKWAQEHLNQTFAGNVSGVVASGLYVALDNGVEGKLHISNLDDDYYIFIEDAQMLRGRSHGRTFRLGDSLTVTISAVNPLARMIDFTQESTDMDTDHKPRARRREDREAERREKLAGVQPSEPRKFTLDDPSPVMSSPSAGRGQGTAGRSGGRGYQRAERGSNDRSGSRSNQGQGRTFGGMPVGERPDRQDRAGSRGGSPRRVITLERPRNEHLRPVNITVQRMYFGDWTIENMPPEESQGGRGDRYPRTDRGSSERGSRGYSRGANDRGAVKSLNGAQTSEQAPRQAPPAPRPQAPVQAQAAPDPAADAGGDDAKRRRRRRGRRGGNGSGAGGTE